MNNEIEILKQEMVDIESTFLPKEDIDLVKEQKQVIENLIEKMRRLDELKAKVKANTKPLKFRAWDTLEKRYIYPDQNYQGHYVLDLNGRFQNLQNGSGGDEYVVQQFTGLKDKKGNLIYEGDIIRLYNGENYTVRFIEESNENETSGYFFSSFGCEVIGNIFENSELLKQ
jgi:hypothetical protein